MFQDYTDHIVKIALDLEVFENDDIHKHDLSVNEWRINEGGILSKETTLISSKKKLAALEEVWSHQNPK